MKQILDQISNTPVPEFTYIFYVPIVNLIAEHRLSAKVDAIFEQLNLHGKNPDRQIQVPLRIKMQELARVSLEANKAMLWSSCVTTALVIGCSVCGIFAWSGVVIPLVYLGCHMLFVTHSISEINTRILCFKTMQLIYEEQKG